MNARDERKDKTEETITEARLLYEEGRNVVAPAQALDVEELRWRETE